MKTAAVKRISKDLQCLVELIKKPDDSGKKGESSIISVDSESIYKWVVQAKAPADSLYGATDIKYQLSVTFSDDYPHEAPTVAFITKLYSPLVTEEGAVCERLVGLDWSPDQRASDAIMLVLKSVFIGYKNSCDHDVRHEARECLEKTPTEFEERVRAFF